MEAIEVECKKLVQWRSKDKERNCQIFKRKSSAGNKGKIQI